MKIKSTITGAALCFVSLGIGASLGHHHASPAFAPEQTATGTSHSQFAQSHLQSDVRLLSAPEIQAEHTPAAPQRWVF